MAEAINATDSTRISYESSGSGPALVWLHGSALSRAPWRGLGYLAGLPGYTHVRVDVRGHGRSHKPHAPAAYHAELLMGDVLAVLAAEGIERAGLIGYSLGARIGWNLVNAHPERWAAFVALAGSHRSQRGQVAEIFFPGYLTALQSGDIDAFVAGFGGLDPATRMAFRANDPLALAALFTWIEQHDPGLPDDFVREVQVPTLLVAGTADTRRFADAQDEVALLPDGRLVPLIGRDHGGTLGAVAPVLAAVQPFLAEVYPASVVPS